MGGTSSNWWPRILLEQSCMSFPLGNSGGSVLTVSNRSTNTVKDNNTHTLLLSSPPPNKLTRLSCRASLFMVDTYQSRNSARKHTIAYTANGLSPAISHVTANGTSTSVAPGPPHTQMQHRQTTLYELQFGGTHLVELHVPCLHRGHA